MSERLIYYFTRMVPDYRVSVLERLHERLQGRLVVCTGHPLGNASLDSLTTTAERSYREYQVRTRRFRGETLFFVPYRRAFQKYGPPAVVIIEESPRSLSLPLLMGYARRQQAGRILWGHFSSNERPLNPRHPLDRYRLTMARRADACVCYTEPIADLLRPYVPAEHLFVARNTLDTDVLFGLYDTLATEGKRAVRRRLGLHPERPVLVFIGRLIGSKGTDRLLDVVRRIQAEQPVQLLLIGDGPERSALEARVAREQLTDVHFLGAMPAWETSAPYLYAADVMLMPGYLGLAVNHAFAFGVPVVSQAAPLGIRYHSPEVAYVEPGRNGMLAPHGDLDALVAATRHVLAHQADFSRNALAYARAHLTINQMVDGLEAAVRYAEAPPSGS